MQNYSGLFNVLTEDIDRIVLKLLYDGDQDDEDAKKEFLGQYIVRYRLPVKAVLEEILELDDKKIFESLAGDDSLYNINEEYLYMVFFSLFFNKSINFSTAPVFMRVFVEKLGISTAFLLEYKDGFYKNIDMLSTVPGMTRDSSVIMTVLSNLAPLEFLRLILDNFKDSENCKYYEEYERFYKDNFIDSNNFLKMYRREDLIITKDALLLYKCSLYRYAIAVVNTLLYYFREQHTDMLSEVDYYEKHLLKEIKDKITIEEAKEEYELKETYLDSLQRQLKDAYSVCRNKKSELKYLENIVCKLEQSEEYNIATKPYLGLIRELDLYVKQLKDRAASFPGIFLFKCVTYIKCLSILFKFNIRYYAKAYKGSIDPLQELHEVYYGVKRNHSLNLFTSILCYLRAKIIYEHPHIDQQIYLDKSIPKDGDEKELSLFNRSFIRFVELSTWSIALIYRTIMLINMFKEKTMQTRKISTKIILDAVDIVRFSAKMLSDMVALSLQMIFFIFNLICKIISYPCARRIRLRSHFDRASSSRDLSLFKKVLSPIHNFRRWLVFSLFSWSAIIFITMFLDISLKNNSYILLPAVRYNMPFIEFVNGLYILWITNPIITLQEFRFAEYIKKAVMFNVILFFSYITTASVKAVINYLAKLVCNAIKIKNPYSSHIAGAKATVVAQGLEVSGSVYHPGSVEEGAGHGASSDDRSPNLRFRK